MVQVALLTTLAIPAELQRIPLRRISEISDIGRTDKVVVLYGRKMGRSASELIKARSTGARVPPVVILAPVLDEDDIVEAFSAGPVSYSLRNSCRPVLGDLLRWAAVGQYGLHPVVLRVLLRHMQWEPGGVIPDVRGAVRLTGREREIMALLAAGESVVTIAGQLGLAQKTVRNNLTRIFAKLQVRRQAEAILKWRGLV